MKTRKQARVFRSSSACAGLSIFLSVSVLPFTAEAAGLWLFEDAGPTVGTASAGRAAIAMDATTARGNAAGMTRLTGEQMLAGAQPIIYTAKFDPDQPGTFGGGDGGDAGAIFPSLAVYYVRELDPDWRIGFAVGSALGLGVDYDNDWAGRYYVQESLFTTVAAIPSLAYRVTNWLSVGGGIGLSYATLDQKSAINNNLTDPGVPDGRLEIDADSWSPFGQASVLLEPTPGTRFGLNYTSTVEHEFDDSLTIKGLGPNLAAALGPLAGANADLEINLPQQVMFSAYHEATDRLAIMGNVAWQEWSDFGETNVTVTATTATELTADRNFDDTWHFALGAMYQVAPDWRLSAGFAFDTSPVDTKDRTPDAPLDRQIRAAGGLHYVLSESLTFGFAYTYMHAGSADISQSGALRGNLVGDYERNELHIIAANVDWRW